MKKREWLLYLVAFLCPMVLMCLVLVTSGIYPFGDRVFLPGDLYHQYLPFFTEFVRNIKAGNGIGYSYSLGIGSNFYALFVYYLASPFHWLALIIPENGLIAFITVLIILKTGLCGLTAMTYLCETFSKKSFSAVFVAIFYAMSGYMAAYNYNIMWLDCIWIFPVIILGLEKLVKEKKCGLYCVTLAFSILSNYYISIMICFFLVLYFIVLLVSVKENRIRAMGFFVFYSLLAGMIAGALWIPEVCAILQTNFGKPEFPQEIKTYFSAMDVLARHFMCVYTERGLDHWPNIYCGSAVLLLVPLYLLNQSISVRDKFCKLGLCAFLLLSFRMNLLDFVWHGFNYPDSLPARQAFIYIFLVLTICYEALYRVKQMQAQQIIYGYLIAVVFYLFSDKFVQGDDYQVGIKLLTILFVTLYAVLLYLYCTRTKKAVLVGIVTVAFAAVLCESGINAWNTNSQGTSRQAYLETIEDQKILYDYASGREDVFFRMEKFTRKTKNDSALSGIPSASLFSSTMNSGVMDFYTALGMRHSKVYYCFDGATAFTSALLNVNYMLGESEEYANSLYEALGNSGEVYLYQNRYTLPFGYVAPFGYELPKDTEYQNKPLELQNRMVENLGVEGQLFTQVKTMPDGDNVCFDPKRGGIYYAVVTASGTTKIDCIGGNIVENSFFDLKKGCVLYLGYLEKGQNITLTNGDEQDGTPKIHVSIYRMEESVLSEAIERLSEQRLEKVVYTQNTLSGEIALKKAGRLILSLPYEDGWRIKLNSKSVQASKFGGGLIALDLEPGDYRIELEYHPVGLKAGIAVSIIGVLMLGVIFVWKRRKQYENQR